MTLVLAVRCHEGVVLASDGQATSDAAGQPTRQPTRKLFALGERIAWGAAGSLGLQQAVHDALAVHAASILAARDPRDALTDAVIPIQQRALSQWVPHAGAQPPELSCIFCWWSPEGPRIFSIPRTGSDHQLHERHAAVGTGDIFASVCAGAMARGIALPEALRLAHDFTAESIRRTLADPAHRWYGVNFEKAVGFLLARLQSLTSCEGCPAPDAGAATAP